MSTQQCALVRFTLFKHSAKSFLAALDNAGISHSPIHMYSAGPQASGFFEGVSALADAMPWNSIAKVMTAWIEARKSREIIIYMDEGKTFHAKGYSASEVEKLLKASTNVVVIDTKPADSE
ncbi:hypothetical protein [Pseudomonas cremoricolorata]|uniref:hypothetical protein n=1 Tax=Pseudomonas cremoricolorata TaxID=157783 RepID=UPI00048B115A|nr:hypothetical protein [Pseudomonas cremoricolorata]